MSLPNRSFAEAFEENFMGDQDLFFGVVGIFEAQHQDYLGKLNSAIKSENRLEIKAWAHKIKGSISHFHHTNPVQLAQKIELMSVAASQLELFEAYKELEAQIQILRMDVLAIMAQMQKTAA